MFFFADKAKALTRHSRYDGTDLWGIFLLSLFFCLILDWSMGPQDCPANPSGRELYQKYQSLQNQLQNNGYQLPIHVVSDCEKKTMTCLVYGEIAYPFDQVKDALCAIENWPDIIMLHENVKTCTTQTAADASSITFYFGRKKYQPPEKAYKITMDYQLVQETADYFNVEFLAEEGPLFTKNYEINIQAIPVKDKTFLRFYCAYDYGNTLKTALRVYYATLARKKVGFTTSGHDKNGNPVYVRGTQGVIERNAVRYYFSIQAYLMAMSSPEPERFDKSVRIWYSLISRFPRQLIELSKDEYIQNKQLERRNQVQYQSRVSPPDGS